MDAVVGEAHAGTIEELRASKTLRLAYDPDAPPFSFIVPGGPPNAEPQGYSVELCRAIAGKLKEQLGIPDLKVTYVPVNTSNRFETITTKKPISSVKLRPRPCRDASSSTSRCRSSSTARAS